MAGQPSRTSFPFPLSSPLAIITAITGLFAGPAAFSEDTNAVALYPSIVVIVDESVSMAGRQAWIADLLGRLDRKLAHRSSVPMPEGVRVTLAGFTSESRILTIGDTPAGAANEIDQLTTEGGVEDGYRAVRDVVLQHRSGERHPITVLLVTDEDRDAADPSLTLEQLERQLGSSNVVVHAVTIVTVDCPRHARVFAVDKSGRVFGPDPAEADCVKPGWHTHQDYAKLAFDTGGLVWNLDFIALGRAPWLDPANAEELDIVAEELADRIAGQWPPKSLVSNALRQWPEQARAGRLVNWDASGLEAPQNMHVAEWRWDVDADGAYDYFGPVVSHIFNSSGEYWVTLEMADDSQPQNLIARELLLDVGR